MPATRDSVVLEILAETKSAVGGLANLVKSLGLVTVATKAMQAAIEQARETAVFNQQAEAFDNLASRAGQSSQQILSAMKEASAGTIGEMELMRAASQASLLGIGFEEMPQLLEIARASARATGQDMAFMFDSIVTGIGRSSPLILDNLGIVVKLGRVNSDYARSLGKTAEELTSVEQKQALLNAVLASGADIISDVGAGMEDVTDVERWQRLSAAVDDFRTESGQALQEIFRPILELGADVLSETANRMRSQRLAASFLDTIERDVRALTRMSIGQLESFARAFENELARFKDMEALKGFVPGASEETVERYTAALDDLRERIEEVREANEGLVEAGEEAEAVATRQESRANEQVRLHKLAAKVIDEERSEIELLTAQIEELLSVEHGGEFAKDVEQAVDILQGRIDDLFDAEALEPFIDAWDFARQTIDAARTPVERLETDLRELRMAAKAAGKAGHESFDDLMAAAVLLSAELEELVAWDAGMDSSGLLVLKKGLEDAGKQAKESAKDLAAFELAVVDSMGEGVQRLITSGVVDGFYQIGLAMGDVSRGAKDAKQAFNDFVDQIASSIQDMLLAAGLKAILAGDLALGVPLVLASGLVALGRGAAQGAEDSASRAEEGLENERPLDSGISYGHDTASPSQAPGTVVIQNIQGSMIAERDAAAAIRNYR